MVKKPDIFSVGYQGYSQASFLRLAERFSTVVDCRSKPVSRKPGFGRRQLEAGLAGQYVWRGDVLGGRGPRHGATDEGIAYLLSLEGRVLIFCMEEAPGDCHRHHAIATALLSRGVDVKHLYDRDIVLASDLAEAFTYDHDPVGHPAPTWLRGLVLSARP